MVGWWLGAVALVIVVVAVGGVGALGPVPAATAQDVTTAYQAVGPVRLADTRQDDCGCTRLAPATIRVVIAGRAGVPAEAFAVAITVTVAESGDDGGYVTVWPSGAPRSETSVLNVSAGQTRANSAIVRLGEGGAVDVYAFRPGQLIVDVSGAFLPTPSATAGRFVSLGSATRVLDTRQPGNGGRVAARGTRTVPRPDSVAADAIAVAVNVTTTGTSNGLGYVTAWPAGQPRPEASLLTTDDAGQERAAFAIIPITPQGFSLYSYGGGHLIVDVVGWFTGPSAPAAADGLFVPLVPARATDTRRAESPVMPGSAICAVLGEGAAVAANVTLTETWTAGYLTAWPAGSAMPGTSNVNAGGSGDTVANGMIVQRSTAGVALYGSAGTDVLVDVAGWFTGTPVEADHPPVAFSTTDPLARPGAVVPAAACAGGSAPSRGFACAGGLDDSDLTAFLGSEHAGLFGGDYQRATKLPDGRILWLFQDAMVRAANGSVRMIHNAAMVQSGQCFTLVTGGGAANPRPWIGAESTAFEQHWWWPMGATMGSDGQLYVFSMEMVERGASYLANPEPVATWVSTVRLSDLTTTRFAPAPDAGTRLYGWSITSDAEWTYLYGNCNKQFGWTPEGHDPCAADVYLARVPKGQPLADPEYRTATGWTADDAAAVPVISATANRLVNPSQVQWDGHRYLAVTKDSDWFGLQVFVDRAPDPWGPWTTYDVVSPPAKCEGCNTYFASWVPWRNVDGSLIIGLSHNRWNGHFTSAYRPTFLTVASAS